MTQTELLKEIEKLQKKGKALSKKAYCGNEHSSKYSHSLYYIYDTIHQLNDKLKSLQTPKQLQPCNYFLTSY